MHLIKPNLSRVELEAIRDTLEREIAGLQLQLEWVENAIAQLDQ
jgi:hypothetical protein